VRSAKGTESSRVYAPYAAGLKSLAARSVQPTRILRAKHTVAAASAARTAGRIKLSPSYHVQYLM